MERVLPIVERDVRVLLAHAAKMVLASVGGEASGGMSGWRYYTVFSGRFPSSLLGIYYLYIRSLEFHSVYSLSILYLMRG